MSDYLYHFIGIESFNSMIQGFYCFSFINDETGHNYFYTKTNSEEGLLGNVGKDGNL